MDTLLSAYDFYEVAGLVSAYNTFGIESICDGDSQCVIDCDVFCEALSFKDDSPLLFDDDCEEDY